LQLFVVFVHTRDEVFTFTEYVQGLILTMPVVSSAEAVEDAWIQFRHREDETLGVIQAVLDYIEAFSLRVVEDM
jgi:hypothetical protein